MQRDPRVAAAHQVQSRVSPDCRGAPGLGAGLHGDNGADEISLLENSINVAGELGTFGRF